MAFTPEQQAQVDIQVAIDAARTAGQVEADAKRAKLEAVRLAKETLIENRRNLPVDQREVTATDITSFANTLVTYVNA